MESHVAGLSLFKNGASHIDISKILKVSQNTVSTWAKKYKWKDELNRQYEFQESSLEYVRGLIHYNLKILDAIKEKMLQTHDLETATIEELKKMLTERGDVDSLNKLYVNIRGKEISWDQVVRSTREFLEYMEYEDHKLAQKLADYANDFLDKKRRSA